MKTKKVNSHNLVREKIEKAITKEIYDWPPKCMVIFNQLKRPVIPTEPTTSLMKNTKRMSD